MKINDVIEKNYDFIMNMSRSPDIVVSQGKTSDDILQDALVTAIKKFKDKIKMTWKIYFKLNNIRCFGGVKIFNYYFEK